MKLILGMIHIWRPWKLSSFQYPQPPCSSTFKNLPAHWPWTSNFKLSPPSPNGNQSIQIKHNPRTTLICYQILPSAFIFSINSLFSSSFHLTFFTFSWSLSAISWLYSLACEVVQNITKCTLFAQSENVNKLWNNNRTVHVNKRNQNKKSCLNEIEHLFHCSIYPTNNAMVSLKDDFTVWRQSQKEDFLSIINYINVWLSMISGHGTNPIFFNRKK